MPGPRWKEFERLAATIYAELHPLAEVEIDARLPGQKSGRPRQIDVLVRWSDNEDEYLMVVDCKDHNRPIDITKIDAFASVVTDVGASRGVLVGNAGFTAPTHHYARNIGIDLANLHDAQSREWSRDLTIPILWIEIKPVLSIGLEGRFESGDTVRMATIEVHDANTGVAFAVTEAFEHAWNSRKLPNQVGHRWGIRLHDVDGFYVQDVHGDRGFRPGRVELEYQVHLESARLGQFAPTRCRGLIDYLDDDALTVSYLPADAVPKSFEDSWQRIDDPSEVIIASKGTLVTSTGFEVLEGSMMVEDFEARRICD